MDLFFIVLGFVALYSWVTFAILTFTKKWSDRNTYEQVVSILAMVFFVAFILGNL